MNPMLKSEIAPVNDEVDSSECLSYTKGTQHICEQQGKILESVHTY